MAHGYKRHGTTTRFAALNVLDGQVIAQCQPSHRHSEWLKLLRQIDRATPEDQPLHLIADNYPTHKHPVVQDWLAEHPWFHTQFTATSALWPNMVERFFGDITTERLRRGVFTSVPKLEQAIDNYIAHHNTHPKPFTWTKSARDILENAIPANSWLSSKHNAPLHSICWAAGVSSTMLARSPSRTLPRAGGASSAHHSSGNSIVGARRTGNHL